MIKRILGFDIETTGLEAPPHKVIEFAGQLCRYDTDTGDHTLIKAFTQRINPERSIGIEAQRVHHITFAMVENEPKWTEVVGGIVKLLQGVDLLVGHNGAGFDLPFLMAQPQVPVINTPLFDTMLHGRWAHALGKIPSLGELAFACDVEYDETNAHSALYDTDVMMKCFFLGIRWGVYHL